MVPLHRTKEPPELQIRNIFKRHLILNLWSKFKIVSQNFSSWCLLPNLHKWCRLAEKRDARAPDENIFKTHLLLNYWSKFKIISQNCSSWYPLPKLHKWLPLTKRPPELQIRNICIFKRRLLLNHRSKFKIISQNCSSWYPLPKLHK